MVTDTGKEMSLTLTDESALYLSLVLPAWRSQVINEALSRDLKERPLIDICDGKGPVNYWRKLDVHKKAEVLRRFGSEGSPDEKSDPELWDVVSKTQPMDFFVMTAKYLSLYQLKYGKVWQATKEITGELTRKLQQERVLRRKKKSTKK